MPHTLLIGFLICARGDSQVLTPARLGRFAFLCACLLMCRLVTAEAGFAAGPDALTSLTNALAAQQPANPVEPPAGPGDALAPPAGSLPPRKPTTDGKSPPAS